MLGRIIRQSRFLVVGALSAALAAGTIVSPVAPAEASGLSGAHTAGLAGKEVGVSPQAPFRVLVTTKSVRQTSATTLLSSARITVAVTREVSTPAPVAPAPSTPTPATETPAPVAPATEAPVPTPATEAPVPTPATETGDTGTAAADPTGQPVSPTASSPKQQGAAAGQTPVPEQTPVPIPGPATITVSVSHAGKTSKLTLPRVSATEKDDTYAATWSAASTRNDAVKVGFRDRWTTAAMIGPKASITGWRTTDRRTAGTALSNYVTVTNAFGRKVSLQVWNGRWWSTAVTYTTQNKASAVLPVRFPATWWTWGVTSRWRLITPATLSTGTTTAAKAATATRAYTVPSKYLQITSKVAIPPGAGYNLTSGMAGVKVYKVRQHFGIARNDTHSIVNSTVMSKVRSFQRSHRLPVTGVVDKRTWTAMGFSAGSWTSLDRYITPLAVNRATTRSGHIERMIATAYTYRGSHYTWGGAGSPANGADCSGLVLQSMYSAGLDPQPINVVKHSYPSYRSSRELYAHPKLKHVPLAQRQRGDLLFWGNGAVSHVGIYLGGNQIIDLLPQGAKVSKYTGPRSGLAVKPTVVRPFP